MPTVTTPEPSSPSTPLPDRRFEPIDRECQRSSISLAFEQDVQVIPYP